MRGRWRDGALALAALLAVLGLGRSLLVLRTPAAADLPAALRSPGSQLAGWRLVKQQVQPGWQGRDLAQGPRYRYRLRPLAGGVPLQLELVVRRSRYWEMLAPAGLTAVRKLRLGPRQQVALGRSGGQPALQTCLVGRGVDESGPTAAVLQEDLSEAVVRWRGRLDWPASAHGQLARALAIQAGLRVSERWECLQVTLVLEGPAAQAEAEAALLAAWRQLHPQLAGWGETWERVTF